MVTHRPRRHTAYVGLGSNQGRRERNITAALSALQATRGLEVGKISSLYETDPVGGPEGQPSYLNAVAELRTTLTARRLLAVCLRIEQSLGRDRSVRWGPRAIDLDLLTYGREIHASPELTVPHPLMHERRFVMEPLAEIAPEFVHPVLGRTARDIVDELLVES